ncbi:MAG: RidA family protein [Bacteroidales bacterium]|nr:RidA family protein [Bacteroidales bacterium]
MIKAIKTDKAPLPVGPYNQAIQAGNTLYVSGQIPLDPIKKEMVTDSIKSQTIQVMDNIKAILEEAGMDFNNVVKVSIFLTDMGNFSEVNDIYKTYFTTYFPARETIQVGKLPLNADVEISLIAVKV